MGHGCDYKCESCGYAVNFQFGGGRILHDYRRMIMDGEYGERAIEVLEEGDTGHIYASWSPYVCSSCGSYRSDAPVVIERSGKRAYTSPVKCDCGKRMRRVNESELKGELTCPKCGGRMSNVGEYLWD